MNCEICGKDLEKVTECAWTSCQLNWNEARIDIIGSNGNDGLIYKPSLDDIYQKIEKDYS